MQHIGVLSTTSLMLALLKWKVLLWLSFVTNRMYLTSLSVPSPTWLEVALPSPTRPPPSSPLLLPTPLKSPCNSSSNCLRRNIKILEL
uniref:Putative ovule protein n=1 Tax=Solanum chacoense TaxID=4108 RepID=A0A0V0GQ15_SOLCH